MANLWSCCKARLRLEILCTVANLCLFQSLYPLSVLARSCRPQSKFVIRVRQQLCWSGNSYQLMRITIDAGNAKHVSSFTICTTMFLVNQGSSAHLLRVTSNGPYAPQLMSSGLGPSYEHVSRYELSTDSIDHPNINHKYL